MSLSTAIVRARRTAALTGLVLTALLAPSVGLATAAAVPVPLDAITLDTRASTDNPADPTRLPDTGGTITDTVTYSGVPAMDCVPELPDECLYGYVLAGELMHVEGDTVTPTGIVGSAEFVVRSEAEGSGTAEVTFEVTAAQAAQYSGGTLVVYQELQQWYYGFGVPVMEPVASHRDPHDADQSVTVGPPPAPVLDSVATTDGADPKVLAHTGGVITDTVTYADVPWSVCTGADPATCRYSYVLEAELVVLDGGAAVPTGVTAASAPFVAAVPGGAAGTALVELAVSADTAAAHAGATLVVLQRLVRIDALDGTRTVVAEHTDPTDADQSVTVATAPVAPGISTSAVDAADGDRVLPWNGGTVVDTVTYQGLVPGVEYELRGELVRPDGSATGIVATVTFTASGSGTVEVRFEVPEGFEGATLVAVQRLVEVESGALVAEQIDLTGPEQTIAVGTRPDSPSPTPSPGDPSETASVPSSGPGQWASSAPSATPTAPSELGATGVGTVGTALALASAAILAGVLLARRSRLRDA